MKIAVFMTGWNKEYLQYLYQGLELAQREFEDEIDAYTCFAELGSGSSFNKSEFEFFQLADMADYDGILLAGTTIKEGDIKKKLIDRILASGKPCVALEEEISGMASVGIDQRAGMQQLVDHLVKKHGIRMFGFLDGPANTYETNTRKNAVEERIRFYGMEWMPEWVVPGGYEFEDGASYGKALLDASAKGKRLPEAVMCANDLMAAGLLDALKGTSLCGKIAVTGFDRYLDGESYSPGITTVERPRFEVPYEGICLLRDIAEGKQERMTHKYLPYRVYVGKTCGCEQTDRFDNEEFRKRVFWKSHWECVVTKYLDSMEEWVADKSSIEELMEAVGVFLENIKAGSAQFFLAENFISGEEASYQNCSQRVLNWHKKTDLQGSDGLKVIMPLHYQHHRMGYAIVSGIGVLFQAGMLDTFFRSLCYAMENCVQRQKYAEVNQKLQRLYRIDPLTGIYNRFGMEDLGQNLYHRNRINHRNTVFIFCDINRLKHINDTYGHEMGDWVIQTTGHVLAQLESEKSIPFRFGGDEFLLITTEDSGVDADCIRKRLMEAGKNAPIDEKLEVSIGVVIAPWEEPENMDVYLNQADEAMYEEKKRFHEVYDRRKR